VTGGGLRRALKGERVDFVEFLIAHDEAWSPPAALQRRLAELNLELKGMHTIQNHKACLILGTFEHHGCVYVARQFDGNPTRQFHEEGCWSADCIYAFGPNQVYGSRIAAFDLGSGRARKLAAFWDKDIDIWETRRQHLELDKFDFIELAHPFIQK
jgi:hypothetical protein